MTEQPYYTVLEASKELGVSVMTIRNYIKSGKIQAKKHFKNIYIPKSEVDKFRL
jgi:excisionase family DNA binding protein